MMTGRKNEEAGVHSDPREEGQAAVSDCERLGELFVDHVCLNLKGRDALEVQHHLKQCVACASEVVELRGIVGMLETFPPVEPNEALCQRVERAVGSLAGRARRSEEFLERLRRIRRVLVPYVLTAAVAAGIIIVVSSFTTIAVRAFSSVEASFTARAQKIVELVESPARAILSRTESRDATGSSRAEDSMPEQDPSAPEITD
jgi:anti-sigma factor RsiW